MQAEDTKVGVFRRASDPAQVLVLGVDTPDQHELFGKGYFEQCMAFDLAAYVADGAAELGLQGQLRPFACAQRCCWIQSELGLFMVRLF
ncbi:MAG: hypothetical protein ACYC5H_16060 [Methylovirgula sp.]